MTLKRPRDENGWRVPADGTFAKRVYDAARVSQSRAEIIAAFPDAEPRHVDAVLCEIRNPDKKNLRHRLMRRDPPKNNWRDQVDYFGQTIASPETPDAVDKAIADAEQGLECLRSMRKAVEYFVRRRESAD